MLQTIHYLYRKDNVGYMTLTIGKAQNWQS